MSRGFRSTVPLAVMLLVALAACGGGSSSGGSGTPQRGGNLVVATLTPPVNFDVTQTSDNESIWAYDEVAETLYINGPDGKSLKPWLATGYTLSSDQLSWTFHLRQGVRFSNGAPMTAQDVVFSIKQNLNSNAAWNFVDTAIADVTAPDNSSVLVRTTYPWAPLLADMALFANSVIPNNYGGMKEADFFQHPIGTGPFMFDQWVQGQYLRLKRNPNYWQPGKPYLDSITYQAVADSNTRVLQLRSAAAQVIENVPFGSIASVRSAGFQVPLFPSTRIDYVTMNEQFAPFKDLHVRRAISYAIDTKAIASAVFFGQGKAANSPLMPNVAYYAPVSLLCCNLTMAKQELAQSSYPNGGFAVDFITTKEDPIQYSIAQIVQQDLTPLNIHVNLRLLDPSQVTAQEQAFQFGMRETYWTMDIIDPDEYISFVLDGTAGSFSNFTHFDDPAIDNLTTQAEKVFSDSERASLYKQIQQMGANEAPIVWIGYSPYGWGYSSKVHGYSVYPEGNTHFEDVWLSS